jgi:hypothetical protein
LETLERLVPAFRAHAANRALQVPLDNPLPYRTKVSLNSFGATHQLDAKGLYTFMRYLVLTDRIKAISVPSPHSSIPITAFGSERSYTEEILTKEKMLEMYAKRKELDKPLQNAGNFTPDQLEALHTLRKRINREEMERIASNRKAVLILHPNRSYELFLAYLVLEGKIATWGKDKVGNLHVKITSEDQPHYDTPEDLVWNTKEEVEDEVAFRKANLLSLRPDLDLTGFHFAGELVSLMQSLNSRTQLSGPFTIYRIEYGMKEACEFAKQQSLIHDYQAERGSFTIYVKPEDKP